MHRTHIYADQPWWTVHWREIAEYRDLLWFLVRRDFTTQYKQSILGPLWFVLQPLATTLVFTVIFGNIAKVGTDGVPPFLFYMSGMVFWTFFQGCLNDISNTFVGNAGIFGKVYFPRLIVPFSLAIKSLEQFLLNLAMFLAFFAYFHARPGSALAPNLWIAVVPALMAQCVLTGMGAGLWLASLTAKYRDLRYALTFLSQLWMFATPIVYSTTNVPAKWMWVVYVNPMSCAVVFSRHAFLGTGAADLALLGSGLAMGALLFVSGLLMFNKVQRTFIDIV